MSFIIQELAGARDFFKFYTALDGLTTSSTEDEAFSWEDEEERDLYFKDLDEAYPERFGPGGSSNPPSGGGRPEHP